MKLEPSNAFTGASWLALAVGIVGFCVGLWNAEMLLNEKGYFLTLLLYGLFSAVSVQKVVRDRMEGIPVTDLYYGICWASAIISMGLMVIGLWNAPLWLSEKGFYAIAYFLSLFAVIAVQKNTRDSQPSVGV
ncbi:MAG: inner membrane protein YiaA [Caldilineaceae bacterium]|jgi:uncharacterized membrane protein YiaA